MLKLNGRRLELMKFSTKKLRLIEKDSELGSIDVINKFKSDKKKALRELD